MNRLVIDAGNTRCKCAVFQNGEIIYRETVAALSLLTLQQIIAAFNPDSTIVSSVINLDDGLAAFISLLPDALILDEHTSLPLTNSYATPATLGRDRLANAAGAAVLFPGKDVLSVDAGTCLKFDFITGKSVYLGGSIAPGLFMRFEALHQFTAQLPLLAPVEVASLIGNSTANSIYSGVINGMISEIEGMISLYNEQFNNPQTVLTGGDAAYFLNHLKKPIFASPELTLIGLHSILVHNFPK